MLKIEKTEVVGWEAAVRGMRNPMNSWDQSDSFICREEAEMTNEEREAKCNKCPRDTTTCGIYDKDPHFIIGPNDLDLIMKLRAAGIDHRKFMRMIEVYVDITAPLYWWKEFDTYKVGTVANSCSTMHKIAAKEFTLEDFSCEHLSTNRVLTCYAPTEYHFSSLDLLKLKIDALNYWRKKYLEFSKIDEAAWRAAPKGNGLTDESLTAAKKNCWWQMIQLLPSSYNQKRTIMLSYEVLANIYKSRRNHKLDEWHTLCDWIEGLPYSEMITGGANCPNKKITVSEADAIAACMLSKLQNSEPTKDLTLTDEWNQCCHIDYIQSVKSNCDIVTDTIGKFKKTVLSQEKGDTSDAKPE